MHQISFVVRFSPPRAPSDPLAVLESGGCLKEGRVREKGKSGSREKGKEERGEKTASGLYLTGGQGV